MPPSTRGGLSVGRDECSAHLGPRGRAGLGSAMGASLTAHWRHLGLVFAARLSQTEGGAFSAVEPGLHGLLMPQCPLCPRCSSLSSLFPRKG